MIQNVSFLINLNHIRLHQTLSYHSYSLYFFYFTDIKIYIYLCTLLCVYILLLLSCFWCSQCILLLSIIPCDSIITIQFSHIKAWICSFSADHPTQVVIDGSHVLSGVTYYSADILPNILCYVKNHGPWIKQIKHHDWQIRLWRK